MEKARFTEFAKTAEYITPLIAEHASLAESARISKRATAAESATRPECAPIAESAIDAESAIITKGAITGEAAIVPKLFYLRIVARWALLDPVNDGKRVKFFLSKYFLPRGGALGERRAHPFG
jgi:hypothetical protein